VNRGRALLVFGCLAAAPRAGALATGIEFQHILNCQVAVSASPAFGAINDLWGAPTWLVPGEMAVAAIVLARGGFTTEARRAADYLVLIQNADGSWCNQYAGTVFTDGNRYTRQTAEVMMLLGRLGGYSAALARADGWLASQQLTATKTGADDGLVGGGLDATGTPLTDRWTSDNGFAVLAFDAAGDHAARDRVVAGINAHLVNGDHWFQTIDAAGTTTDGTYGWINFAPAFLTLSSFGVVMPAGVAAGMASRLQQPSGPDAGAVREFEAGPKYMPGIGFQASIAWRALGHVAEADAHTAWAANVSGLWTTSPDGNGDAGGWVDWTLTAGGGTANWWERFIDTSAYAIMVANGWSFVEPAATPPGPTPRPFSAEAVVYPNPATGDRVTLSLALPAGVNSVSVRIYAPDVRLVWRGTWSGADAASGTFAIAGLTRWAPGVYLVKARATVADGSVKSYRLVRLAVTH
jgi:hypothetical protein